MKKLAVFLRQKNWLERLPLCKKGIQIVFNFSEFLPCQKEGVSPKFIALQKYLIKSPHKSNPFL